MRIAMRPTIRALAVVAALLAGCATVTQKRADQAFERGDFVSAAELYDGAVREKPTSQKLLAKRWQARAKAVAELVRRADDLRRSGNQQASLGMAQATAEARNHWFSNADAPKL